MVGKRKKKSARPTRETDRLRGKETGRLADLPATIEGPKQDLASTESGRGGRSLGTISLGRDNYGSVDWRSNFAVQYQLGSLGRVGAMW